MLERHVQERSARLGENVFAGAVAKLGVDVDATAVAACQPGRERELPVDRHGPPEADEDARRDGREAVPGGKEAARFVEGGRHEPAVHDAGPRLVARTEAEGRLVTLDPLLGGLGQAEAVGVVAAAPAEGVVMRGNAGFYLSPPRSKCAR
jgi:hypothetical protein